MHTLSAQEILRIWEIGSGQHPVDRALTILAAAFQEAPRDALPCLSVGQRDSSLLDVRKLTFGTHLASFNECMKCQERLEFEFDVDDIRVAPGAECMDQEHTVMCGGDGLHFRFPTRLGLPAISRFSGVPPTYIFHVCSLVLSGTQE